MAQYDGSIRIGTKINTDGIERGFSSIKTSADKFKSSINQGMSTLGSQITNINGKIKNMGSRMRKEVTSTKRSVDGLSGSFRNLSSAIISAFAVKKVAGIATSFTELGSDLEEVQNVVDVTFTTMSDKVDAFAKSAAKAAGLSETMAKRYVGTFGAMSKSFGFAEDAALGMSTTLTQLAGDVASFYNISQDEAYTKLKSVFTGETETLKDLGVVMTENALNSYAMAKGIGKTVSKMTEQEKVALRYQFVLEKLSGASGDFVRTQDSWANQTRILKLQIESLKATIGQGLINVFTPLLKMLNTLLEKLRSVANAFKSFTESFFGKSSAGGSNAGAGYVDTAEDITSSLEDVSDAAQDAEKSLEGYLSPLDEINKYETGKDDDILSGLEDIDFGQLGDMNIGVTVTPEIDDSALSDKFAQMAEKVKSVLQSLFNPLKEAWDREGQFVMDSWKYALGEVWGLIKDIGRDFLTVWQQEATISIFQDILHIIGDIGLVVGNLARNFREAWNENEVGLHILEKIRDILGIIVGHIRNAADATVEWSDKLDFYPLLDAFDRFLESLKPAVDAISGTLEDFYTKVILPLGTWTLEKGLPELLQVFIDFNNKVDWESLRANLAEFWEHLEPFAETVGEGLIIFIGRLSDALANFINSPEFSGFLTKIEEWMDSVTPEEVADGFQKIAIAIIALNAAGSLLSFISTNFSMFSAAASILKGTLFLLPGVISALGSALSLLASPIGIVVAAVAALAAGFIYAYNTSEEFRNKVSELKDKFIEFWEGSLKPMLDEWGEKFRELWEEHIKPALEKIGEALKTLWEDMLIPIADWIVDTLLPILLPIIDKVFNSTMDWIGELFDDIGRLSDIVKDCVGIIVDLLHGDFAGAWEHAWNIVKTVWDNITSKISLAVEHIKGWVNDLLGLFEKADGKSSSVGGGESYQSGSSRSFSTRSIQTISPPYTAHPAIAKLSDVEIPGYATGQVIPRTMKKHLAILGDNSRETEVVSPLSTIEEAVINAMAKMGITGGSAGGTPVNLTLQVTLDKAVLGQKMIDWGKIQQMATGVNPYNLGTT